ncbi:MAG TPA: serine/threonine-protein kinase [Polyangiales bacterium]|nr:serine/threonine-protein kinase [Polyangiales bacterium]
MTSRPVPTAVSVEDAPDPQESGQAPSGGRQTVPIPPAELQGLIPQRVIGSKYRLAREIGHGGMGAVWEAEHEALGRRVAVKFLKPWSHNDPTVPDRFAAEAKLVAAIKHRFVVDVFDFGITEDGLYYMVLELLDGQTLADRMNEGPPLTAREAVQLVADCLRGLHAVHEAGVVHRDLKPENVFVVSDADGMFPKLIDFGISTRDEPKPQGDAAAERRKSRLTQPGVVVGTLAYMPPEQLRGRADLDRRADVYSMGVILYELLAGQLPYPQDNVADLMLEIMNVGAPPLSRMRPDLGAALSDTVARALSALADARFPSAMALRESLLAALPGLPAEALSGITAAGVPAGGGRGHLTELQLQAAADPFASSASRAAWMRGPKLWIGVALAGSLLLGGYLLSSGSSEKPAAASGEPIRLAPPVAAPVEAPPPPMEPAVTPTAPEHPAPAATQAVRRESHVTRSTAPAKPPRSKPKAAPKKTKKIYRELDF